MKFLNLFQELKSAGGTSFFTLAAGCTDFDSVGITELRTDNSLETTVNKTKETLACYFFTNSYAETAKDTFIRVSVDKWMSIVDSSVMAFACIMLDVCIILVCIVNKLTFVIVVAAAFKTS